MQVNPLRTPSSAAASFRYVESAPPVFFPESAEVPESDRHLQLRTALYLLLRRELAGRATVGSDLFIYYDASDPSRCVAPDAYVRLAPRVDLPRSWKVWERGAPEVAVEIVNDADTRAAPWDTKLQHYRRLGVKELLLFSPDAESPLRIWDRVDGALLEREVSGARAPSSTLDLAWVVAPADDLPVALRIARTTPAYALVPTDAERIEAEAEARRAEAEARRKETEARRKETEARLAAEARVRELEAELARRG